MKSVVFRRILLKSVLATIISNGAVWLADHVQVLQCIRILHTKFTSLKNAFHTFIWKMWVGHFDT